MQGTGRFQRAGGRLPELALEGDAVTFAPQSLPGHRLLRLRLRNAGREPVVLHAAELALIDDDGHDLHASSH